VAHTWVVVYFWWSQASLFVFPPFLYV
jgi:hypothetical protein